MSKLVWETILHPAVDEFLEQLPRGLRAFFIAAIDIISEDPYHRTTYPWVTLGTPTQIRYVDVIGSWRLFYTVDVNKLEVFVNSIARA